MTKDFKNEIKDWIHKEKLAIRAIGPIYSLMVDRSVELLLFRRVLVNLSPVDILKTHFYARMISGREIGIEDTLPIIETLSGMPVRPSRVDLGRLTIKWMDSDKSEGLHAFLESELAAHLKEGAGAFEARDVVLYGFGRIGRLMARILTEQSGGGHALKLRAVVCRGDLNLEKRAKLLLRDSVHGPLKGNLLVKEDEDAIIVNGSYIKFISANSPDELDYESYGIHNALIIDNTGVWRDRAGLGKHLESKGVDRVLLTAPGKGDIPNIVYGANHREWSPDERIFSAASCTTNAIVPPLKVINDHYGIEYAHVETVHSYTNDQNLLDNFHKKSRRGRSAPLNMVLTETGAAKAVAKVIPELEGKLSGNAVRVPTPNISLAILNLTLGRAVDRDELNQVLHDAALEGPLMAQLDYTRDEDVVSSDMVGNTHAGIVDSLATLTHENHATVYVWYDNEYGYSMQVARVARIISGVERLRYY